MNIDICRGCNYWKEQLRIVDFFNCKLCCLDMGCKMNDWDIRHVFLEKRKARIAKKALKVGDCLSFADDAYWKLAEEFGEEHKQFLKELADGGIVPKGCVYRLEQDIPEWSDGD